MEKQDKIEAEEVAFLDVVTMDEQQLNDKIITVYNAFMSNIYREYTQYSQEELKIKCLKVLTSHILGRLDDSLKVQQRKIKKLKQIKEIINH